MIGARAATILAVVIGGLAVVGATVAGGDGLLLTGLTRPPTLIRAALVGCSAALAVTLLGRAIGRLANGSSDVPGMVRGVRLAFLAVAAASAGVGWALGDPLPLVIALVIAGVDVIETSLLLLVVLRNRP